MGDVSVYVPDPPEGVFKCYDAVAQVYSNGDSDTNCGESECTNANSLVKEALETMSTRSCEGNYTRLCGLSNGTFTPITDKITGTDRCCRYPRLEQSRQSSWCVCVCVI